MNLKSCKEYKEAKIWNDTLCRWCVSPCAERWHGYDLAGKRWSLKVGGYGKRAKRTVKVGLEKSTKEKK